MTESDEELNSKCFTYFLLKFSYSEDSNACLSLSIVPFISTSFQLMSAYIPSQAILQLKLSANKFSMQSLPLGLHTSKPCVRTIIPCSTLSHLISLQFPWNTVAFLHQHPCPAILIQLCLAVSVCKWHLQESIL